MPEPKAKDDAAPTCGEVRTPCQERIEPMMAHLRQALEHSATVRKTATDADRDVAEEELCLATRSAFFDFNTWVDVHNEVDEPAATELEELLTRALQEMRRAEFVKAVTRRCNAFRKLCDRVRNDEASSLLSAADA